MRANPPSFKSRWQRAIGESGLPPTTRLILLTLSVHFMDEEGGHCYPKIVDLMQVTSISKPHVIRHLNRAVEIGWLERRSWGKGRGYRRWNYQAVLPLAIGNKICHLPQAVFSEHSVTQGNQEVEHLVTQGNQVVDGLVTQGNHKPWRDLTMERACNHAPAPVREKPAAPVPKPAPTLSMREKNRMTKLTDAIIETAQKTILQRGIREDLRGEALIHSIEKCKMQKGYLEMTEPAWIETIVAWVGKERSYHHATAHSGICASLPPAESSSEEKARQDAIYATRMAIAEENYRKRIKNYHASRLLPSETVQRPANPVEAIRTLAKRCNTYAKTISTSSVPPPAQRGSNPRDTLPSSRPPLSKEQHDMLNRLLLDMKRAGCVENDFLQVYQAARSASEEMFPVIVTQARQRWTPGIPAAS